MNVMRKPWSDEYLRQAIADEIELAEACGYGKLAMPAAISRTAPLVLQRRSFMSAGHARATPEQQLPRWRRDWNAAGDLIEELNLSVRQDDEDGTVSVGVRGQRRDVTESYADHPDKGGAILAAITKAATQLKAEQRDNAADARQRYRRYRD